MKDLLVIISCTQEKGLLAEYKKQLTAANIDYYINHYDIQDNGCLGSIGSKFKGTRQLLDKFSNYEKIVFSDAWDVLFYGTKEQVKSLIPNDRVIMAAERNCFPDQYLTNYIQGTTPWRYVNGGLWAGVPIHILKWIEANEKHEAYHPQLIDQQYFNQRLLQKRYDLVPIDYTTTLFYCMVFEGGELNFENGIPVNTMCETRPPFIHFNGNTPHTNFKVRLELSKKG
jgi:hypothetical protein